jgi:hypothetical protein
VNNFMIHLVKYLSDYMIFCLQPGNLVPVSLQRHDIMRTHKKKEKDKKKW